MRQLQNYMKGRVLEKTHEFRHLAGKLNTLSPLNILQRGYSLTYDSGGRLLADGARIRKGEAIKTRLAAGTLFSRVERVQED